MRAIVQRVTAAKVVVRSDSGSGHHDGPGSTLTDDSGSAQRVAVGGFVPTSGPPQASGTTEGRVTATSRCVATPAGEIGPGLCLLVGIHKDDTPAHAKKLADKIATLRIFNDQEGKMNLSLLDNPGYDILAVSNFTVYGDTKKNRRPSFTESAPYEKGQQLFEAFVQHLRELGFKAPTGVFGADMEVTIINDGPVTLIVDV